MRTQSHTFGRRNAPKTQNFADLRTLLRWDRSTRERGWFGSRPAHRFALVGRAERRSRYPRHSRRGFKLVETLVSMAILSIAAAGLVRLHSSIVRGIASSEDMSVAMDVAAQRLEELVPLGPTGIPNCVAATPPGCAAGGRQTLEIALTDVIWNGGTFNCSRWVDSADVPMVGGVAIPAGSRFRVDTQVQDHAGTQQNAGARVLTISVCWEDLDSQVRQVQNARLLVPGV